MGSLGPDDGAFSSCPPSSHRLIASEILIPLAPAAFAPLYGMLTDRCHVTWIVGADTAPSTD